MSLIEDVFDLSKIQLNRIELSYVMVLNLGDLMNEALSMCHF